MSIDAASRSTRIRPRYLAALEEDAGTDAFPGPIYATFFLKEYARYLGVEEEPLVTALRERTSPPPPSLRLVRELEQPRRWVSRVIHLAAIAAMVAIVAYTVLSAGGGDDRAPSESARAGLTEVPAFGQGHAVAAEAPSPDVPIRAALVVRAATRVEAFVDGERVVKRTVEPRRLVLRARAADSGPPSIELDVADGSAVRLVVNGRVVPTAHRAPFHARFVWSSGRMVRL